MRQKVKVISTTKASGDIPLTEAEIVVSGGRGLKGPENWGMVEELAEITWRCHCMQPASCRCTLAPAQRTCWTNGHRHRAKFIYCHRHIRRHPAFGRREPQQSNCSY